MPNDTRSEIPPQPVAVAPVLHRRRWPWVAAAAAATLAVAGITYWATRTAEPAASATGRRFDPAARAIPVVAAPARKGSIDVYLNALGTVTPASS
jgi:multidrug efflux system membrane fusion protein